MADLRRLHRNVKSSLAGRSLLAVCAGLYGAGVGLRALLYRLGLLRRRRLPIRTVCFGNLTAGGTGKTSAVLLAAEQLAADKRRPAVLSRGYGRPRREKEVLVLAPGREPSDWRAAGDEPWMIRQALREKKVPVLVSPDRYAAGLAAANEHGADVALLDDGFQHLALERDVDVVLLNAADPFGGGLLPYGLCREPRRALRRAALILLTHVERTPRSEVIALREELKTTAPQALVAEAIHKPKHVLDARTGRRLPLKRLKGRAAVALSGLGDPAGFEGTLKRLGAEVVHAWRYPDHHIYSNREMRSIENLRGGAAVVTTMKDLPRLPKGWQEALGGDVWALCVGLRIVRGREAWKKVVLG